jgi:hypothetical protein
VTHHNGNHHVGAAAKRVAEHASALTRLEVELASLEIKKKAMSFGVGVGLGLAAALLGLLGLAFAFATATAAIALLVPVWLALLIVTGVLLILAGVAGVTAVGRLRRATPPLPEAAIREAKMTTEAIKR